STMRPSSINRTSCRCGGRWLWALVWVATGRSLEQAPTLSCGSRSPGGASHLVLAVFQSGIPGDGGINPIKHPLLVVALPALGGILCRVTLQQEFSDPPLQTFFQ